jgi:hypothetical protein
MASPSTWASNPLMQYGLPEVTERQRLAVLNAMQTISYVPMEVSMIGSPVYDLGDVLLFTGGIAGERARSPASRSMTGPITAPTKRPVSGRTRRLCQQNRRLIRTSQDSCRPRILTASITTPTSMQRRSRSVMAIKERSSTLKYATQKATYIEFHAEIKLRIDTTETSQLITLLQIQTGSSQSLIT